MGKENNNKHQGNAKENKKSQGNTEKKKAKEKKQQEKAEESAATDELPPSLDELMRGVKLGPKLVQALEDVREPTSKTRIADDVRELAWEFKNSCEGYKSEPHGALFSEVLNHVHAAECRLVRDQKGPLPTEDCQRLWDLARGAFENVSGICVKYTTPDGKTHEAWGSNHLRRSDITSVIVSGPRKVSGGWMLPTSLELSVSHSKHANDVKVADIVDNIDKGDFATVVLQLQDLFKQKKKIRDELVALDNEYLGKLRFFVSQLQMLDEMGAKFKEKALDYIRSAIGGLNLEWYQKDPSTKAANDALQQRAAIVLKATYPSFVKLIKPSSQRDIFIAAYEKTLGC